MRLLTCLIFLFLSITSLAKVNINLQMQLKNMAAQHTEIHKGLNKYKDQDAPEALQILAAEIDALHRQTLTEIIKLHGWPNNDLVDKEGSQAAYLIVKDSHNLAFQQNMLPLIIQSYINKGGVSGQNVAQLTDQVSLKQGKKQVFGTQFEVLNGNVIFKPIENFEAIDTLRAELELIPFSEFKKQLEAKYSNQKH